MWAEGGLWSSVEDLSRWLSFQFREDGAGRQGSQILAGETVKEMHKARYLGDDAWTAAFCISWYAARKDEVIWIQHAGGLNGFITNICFNPKERVGAIVLLNGIADAAVLSLELAAIARDAVREAAIAIEPAAPMPPAYRDLLGMYVDEEQAMIARLEWRRGAPDRRPGRGGVASYPRADGGPRRVLDLTWRAGIGRASDVQQTRRRQGYLDVPGGRHDDPLRSRGPRLRARVTPRALDRSRPPIR